MGLFRRARGRDETLTPYFLLLPAFAILFALLVFPILWNVYVSFHDVSFVTILKEWPYVGLDNFTELLHDDYFFESLKVSVFFVGGCVLFQFLCGLLLAMLLHQRLMGTEAFRAIFVVPWLFSAVIAGFSWRWMYNETFGLVNYGFRLMGLSPQGWLSNPDIAIWSIVLSNIWFGTPFSMLFMGAALTSIEPELYEAAIVDGATRWQSFLHITLPLLKPFIATNLILITIWTMNLFDLQLVMTGGGPLYSTTTASLYMYRQAFEFGHLSTGASVGFIMLLINAIAAFIYTRTMGT